MDEKSFQEFVQKVTPRLKARAIKLCGWRDQERINDLIQETLLKMQANPHYFRKGSKPCAVALAILQNLVRSQERRKKRAPPLEELYRFLQQKTGPVEDHGIQEEELQNALDELSGRNFQQYEAIILRYMEGLLPAEIAVTMNKSSSTVRRWLDQGLNFLRERLSG